MGPGSGQVHGGSFLSNVFPRILSYCILLYPLGGGAFQGSGALSPLAAGRPPAGCLCVGGGGGFRLGDEDDDELEHGRAHDDMWALDLGKYTVGLALGWRFW